MKSSVPTSDFLEKLKSEAKLQSRLNTTRFFPEQLDKITSFIGKYPWQVIVAVSGVTALSIEAMKFLVL